MKKPYRIFVTVLAVALAQISCSKETPSGEELHDQRPAEPRVITVAFGSAVKSRLEDDYTPKFCNGDKILVSNGTTAQELTVSIDDGGKASITTTLDGTLKAVYPSNAAQLNGNEITGVKVPAVQDGTFANANIAMAEDITTNATFKNRTVLFIVTPPDGTEFIRVTSDSGPINTEGADDAGKKQITVSGKDTSGNFYVSIRPGVKLSDLSFDTGSRKKEISEADITTAGKSDEALIAGNLYKINNTTGWTAYPSPIDKTIAAVNVALESGTTAIEIEIDIDSGDTENTIVLPSAVDSKDVFLNITGVSSKELSFVYAEDAQGPANLFIATDAQILDIDCPNTHVEVNGGSYGQIIATTSAATLSVGRNVTVETLNIRGGNAEIHGTVTNVLRAGNNKVTWHADTPEKLNAGLGKAAAGDDIYITEPGEYINGSVWLPAGCTLEATVPGVVFNYNSPQMSENWIANSGANAKVKNITWNILNNANYQFIHFDDIEGCTFNGRIYPHGMLRFTDCTFNSSGYEYCVTTWASGSTFKGCTFNTQGKAINVYGGGLTTYTFEDCIFNATNIPEGKGKAAIFVKDGTDSDCGNVSVIITRCTANYERPYDQLDPGDPSLSQSVLWNVEKGSRSAECDVKVTLDGRVVYSDDAVVPQS